MSISTQAELLTALYNWLDISSGNFATSQAQDLTMIGEKWIMRNVRAREMEAAFNVTISSGVAAVPSGYLGAKKLYIDGTPVQGMTPISLDQLYEKYPLRSADGKPKFFAYSAGNLEFGPFPDSTYTVKGTYYARQGPLSSGTYSLFTNNPDLFLFAALAESELVFGRDNRMPLWKAKRDEITQQLNAEAQGIAYAGGMAITPG